QYPGSGAPRAGLVTPAPPADARLRLLPQLRHREPLADARTQRKPLHRSQPLSGPGGGEVPHLRLLRQCPAGRPRLASGAARRTGALAPPSLSRYGGGRNSEVFAGEIGHSILQPLPARAKRYPHARLNVPAIDPSVAARYQRLG